MELCKNPLLPRVAAAGTQVSLPAYSVTGALTCNGKRGRQNCMGTFPQPCHQQGWPHPWSQTASILIFCLSRMVLSVLHVATPKPHSAGASRGFPAPTLLDQAGFVKQLIPKPLHWNVSGVQEIGIGRGFGP